MRFKRKGNAYKARQKPFLFMDILILITLILILLTQIRIQMTLADFQALQAAISAVVDNIQEDLLGLKARVEELLAVTGGLTADQEAEVAGLFEGLLSKLQGVAEIVPDPVVEDPGEEDDEEEEETPE